MEFRMRRSLSRTEKAITLGPFLVLSDLAKPFDLYINKRRELALEY